MSKAANQTDQAAIRAVIELYFKGHATGDSGYMRQAFLPTAHIEGYRGNTFLSWTLDEYCAIFQGTPAPDEALRTRTIELIDAEGPAATAKATLVHGTTIFTDYFVLLKTDEGWKIANKVFSSRAAQ